MDTTRWATFTVLLGLLGACSHSPLAVVQEASAAPYAVTGYYHSGPSGPAHDSVDAYKSDVAAHIMRNNADYTFSGRLPPMLPAIVVLRITVDEEGRMTDVWVQRSIDEDASRVALASMQRTGMLPRPPYSLVGPQRALSFSETFLFNADYRFQLRTLAPIQ